VEEVERYFSLNFSPGMSEFDRQRSLVNGFQKTLAQGIIGSKESRDDVSGELGERVVRVDESHCASMQATRHPTSSIRC
jgi:hypothetical protein